MPHPVPLNMTMPPTGVVVHTTYNTPPPFVSPTTQASSAGTIFSLVSNLVMFSIHLLYYNMHIERGMEENRESIYFLFIFSKLHFYKNLF